MPVEAVAPGEAWTAQQWREAFPWEPAPRYLLRDRDRNFEADFVAQVKAMGIKQAPSGLSPGGPELCYQNAGDFSTHGVLSTG